MCNKQKSKDIEGIQKQKQQLEIEFESLSKQTDSILGQYKQRAEDFEKQLKELENCQSLEEICNCKKVFETENNIIFEPSPKLITNKTLGNNDKFSHVTELETL